MEIPNKPKFENYKPGSILGPNYDFWEDSTQSSTTKQLLIKVDGGSPFLNIEEGTKYHTFTNCPCCENELLIQIKEA